MLELHADYWLNRDIWCGAGPVWNTGINFHSDGMAPDLSFDNAAGAKFRFGWRWAEMSFTAMNYKDHYGNKYNADNVGVGLVGRF